MADALNDATLRPVSDPLISGSVTLEDLLSAMRPLRS